MSVGAIIKDGVIQETASQSSVQQAAEAGNGMGKDAFLQLLVAQMKYQDPLEPTSNTEYISQYATFSQVEQMQNMASTMELTRASSMVGKLVTVQSTNSSGETKEVEGIVEYVSYENNKAYVSIDGTLYSADDVVAILDETYYTAFELAKAFEEALNKLPSLNELSLEHQDVVTNLQEGFNNMTAYQQSFIPEEYVDVLQEYVKRMAVLVEENEANKATETEDVEDTEGAEEVTEVEEVTEEGAVAEDTVSDDETNEDATGDVTADENA